MENNQSSPKETSPENINSNNSPEPQSPISNKIRHRSVTELDFRSVYVIKRAHMTGHRAAIYAIDRGDTPSTILTGGGDGLVVKWDLHEPEVGQVIARIDANIFSMKYLPQFNRLAIGNMHGGVHWIDLNERANDKNIAAHDRGVFDIQWIKGEILTAGGNGRLVRWNAETGTTIQSLQISAEQKSLRSITYHAIRNEIAIGSSDYSIYILNADTFTIKKRIALAHDNSVFAVKYSPDGKYLMSGGRDAHLKVWEVERDYELISIQPAHWFTINQIEFSPDGRLFATVSRDKSIKIWNANNFKLMKVIERVRLVGHTHSVNAALWTAHHDWLITASDDRVVMAWNISKRK